MANWLDKALGRKEATAVEPVPFVSVCQCGLATEGQRRERAQRVICARCGAAHFVLPVNRYPISERKFLPDAGTGLSSSGTTTDNPQQNATREAASQLESPTDADDPFIDSSDEATEPELDLVESAWSSGNDPANDAEDYLDDDDDSYELADSDAEIKLSPTSIRPKKAKAPQVASKERSPAGRTETSQQSGLELSVANDGQGSQRLRLAAVVGLIVVVAGAAIVWTIRERNLEYAEIAMREGRDIGEAALNSRDFVTAREKLREALDSMKLLGVEAEAQERTRLLWLQAEAGFGLLDSTDVVEIALAAIEAEPADEEYNDDEWQRQFRTRFYDRWLCIQLDPVATISGDEEFGKRVVFPVQPVIHLAGIDAVLDQQSGEELWFAGPLRNCRRDPLDSSAWLIEFDSTRVIACDGTEPLIRPMLTEEEQNEAIAALSKEATSQENGDDIERPETDND